MVTEIIEQAYHRVNEYKRRINELSYDDVTVKANRNEINTLTGKIAELNWIIGKLYEEDVH